MACSGQAQRPTFPATSTTRDRPRGHEGDRPRSRSRRIASKTRCPRPFVPEKRWTCWSSGNRRDWFEVDFGMPRKSAASTCFSSMIRPSGECRPPESFEVESFDGGRRDWSPINPTKAVPEQPRPGENRIRFDPSSPPGFASSFTTREPAFTRVYTGCDRSAKPTRHGSPPDASPLQITCDKFITDSDTLVSIVRVHNPTEPGADDLRRSDRRFREVRSNTGM